MFLELLSWFLLLLQVAILLLPLEKNLNFISYNGPLHLWLVLDSNSVNSADLTLYQLI